MNRLEVSDRWQGLSREKTWADIFEETVKRHPQNEALVFTESDQRRDMYQGSVPRQPAYEGVLQEAGVNQGDDY